MDWLCERVVAALKSKAENFSKLIAAEEGEIIKTFMEDDQKSKLFFTAGAKDMQVYETPPVNTKKKVFFVMKPEEVKISPKEINTQLVCGDLPPALLENFWSVLEGVYLPMLSNPKNQHVRGRPLPHPPALLRSASGRRKPARSSLAMGQ